MLSDKKLIKNNKRYQKVSLWIRKKFFLLNYKFIIFETQQERGSDVKMDKHMGKRHKKEVLLTFYVLLKFSYLIISKCHAISF